MTTMTTATETGKQYRAHLTPGVDAHGFYTIKQTTTDGEWYWEWLEHDDDGAGSAIDSSSRNFATAVEALRAAAVDADDTIVGPAGRKVSATLRGMATRLERSTPDA